MKNRFAAMTLAGIMAAALFAGCGGKNDSDTASKSASAPVAQSSAAEQAQSSAEEVKVQPVAVDAAWYGEMDRPDKTEADGSIADWFLFGQYKSVYFDGSDGCDKRIFDEIPDMTFHTGETNHVLSRAVSSVPVAMTCGRATSLGKDTTWLHTRDDWAALNGRLQAEHPEDADALLENIVELYNTPLADMSLIGEDGAVYNRFRYTYTVEGNVMTCRQVRGLKDDFTLEYYEDAEPQVYNLRFENDSLVMENVNGGTVTLLPQQKWDIPLSIFCGKDDNTFDHVLLQDWKQCTSAHCSFYEMEGGHFFLNDHAEKIAEIILQTQNRLHRKEMRHVG